MQNIGGQSETIEAYWKILADKPGMFIGFDLSRCNDIPDQSVRVLHSKKNCCRIVNRSILNRWHFIHVWRFLDRQEPIDTQKRYIQPFGIVRAGCSYFDFHISKFQTPDLTIPPAGTDRERR